MAVIRAAWSYIAIALIVFLTTLVTTHVGFHAAIFHQSLAEAAMDFFHNVDFGIVATLWLIWPYIAVALISSRLLRNPNTTLHAPLFLSAFLVFVSIIYCSGILGSQQALYAHAWTAAALSLGLTPFLTIPILIIAFLVMLYLLRKPTIA
jgi:hypothetical protein